MADWQSAQLYNNRWVPQGEYRRSGDIDEKVLALAGWRTVAVHLKGLPNGQAREEAAAVLQTLPQELRAGPVEGSPPGCASRTDEPDELRHAAIL
jgi:hypothetical protein